MDVNEKCPWCGSAISHERFVQIENKIREQERKRLEEAETALRKQLESKFSKDLDAARKAVSQATQEEANKRIAQAAAERDKALEQSRLLQAREAQARKEAQEAAQSAVTLKTKFDQQLDIEKQAAEKRGREEAQKEVVALRAHVNQSAQQIKQLEAREAAIRKEAQVVADSRVKNEVEQARVILQRESEIALLKQQAESNRRDEALQKKLQEMQHKLDQKTANQLGDGAEIDLYEALREGFPNDRINRVPKGQAGPDIRQYVLHNGEVCGQIIYDSKNHQAWRDAFVTKLRQDQLDTKAEHAILATTVFPSGKKELCVESGVVVVNPVRAVHVTALLREFMVTMHVRGLSQKERAGKTNKLYEYITSKEYCQQFQQVGQLNADLLEVDVEEKKTHDKVWRKRGELLIKQRNALREIETHVSAIVEAGAGTQTPAA